MRVWLKERKQEWLENMLIIALAGSLLLSLPALLLIWVMAG